MHLDLNSCFATAYQQAYPKTRGKPLCIAAYDSPRGCIIAPSIEAKRLGVKTGMRVMDARYVCKDIIVRTAEYNLVRDIHTRLKKILREYSPSVVPKSIDEAVIDFSDVMTLYKKDLSEVGQDIKARIRNDIGEWISCSIGIGTNRFLAKTAASLKKPDGLEVITWANVRQIYSKLLLVDLCGINTRYQARLNSKGIFTPLQFLDAGMDYLKKEVFHSIVGYHWFKRLRGWEVDEVEFARKSIGQDYALGKKTADQQELAGILMKLCEKMGRRLRRMGYRAQGIHIGILYDNYTYWHRARLMNEEMYTTQELYRCALLVFNQQPEKKVVSKLSVACYGLTKQTSSQLSFFDEENRKTKLRSVSDALDSINNRYGEFTITPGNMVGMQDVVVDRIAFGGVKEIEDLYLN